MMMIFNLATICIILLTILAVQVNSQSSLFDLFQTSGAQHGGEHGPNIHTLYKFASPSYHGTSEQSAEPAMNSIQNPYFFQQPQQIYRYPQNYYYPQQYYGK